MSDVKIFNNNNESPKRLKNGPNEKYFPQQASIGTWNTSSLYQEPPDEGIQIIQFRLADLQQQRQELSGRPPAGLSAKTLYPETQTAKSFSEKSNPDIKIQQ